MQKPGLSSDRVMLKVFKQCLLQYKVDGYGIGYAHRTVTLLTGLPLRHGFYHTKGFTVETGIHSPKDGGVGYFSILIDYKLDVHTSLNTVLLSNNRETNRLGQVLLQGFGATRELGHFLYNHKDFTLVPGFFFKYHVGEIHDVVLTHFGIHDFQLLVQLHVVFHNIQNIGNSWRRGRWRGLHFFLTGDGDDLLLNLDVLILETEVNINVGTRPFKGHQDQ